MKTTHLQDSMKFTGQVKWIKSKDGKIISESPWMSNKVLANSSRGIYLFLDRLANITTYAGVASHADMGDNSTPASSADTGCINAIVRAAVGLQTRSGSDVTFRFFFSDSVTPNDTYYEFSVHTDGTATVGSGRAFNRLVMTTPLVKSTGEDHTIVCKITGSV